MHGYCGAEFSHMPDNEAPHAMNSKVDATLNKLLISMRSTHCTGGQFLSKSPWID